MRILKGVVSLVSIVALATSLVAVGLAVCLLPATTYELSSMFSRDDISVFSRTQLVQVAEATREYSFGTHGKLALYQTIYGINEEYLASVRDAGGTVPADFPHLEAVTDANSVEQLEAAFEGASEKYCFSKDCVSHLDDCYAVAHVAVPALIAVAAVALAGLLLLGVVWRVDGGYVVPIVSGTLVLLAFAALGGWALVDFSGLFTMFHRLFFSQGNWQFAFDSLLICALPTEFWMGMGGMWLLTSVVFSLFGIAADLFVRAMRGR